MTGYCTSSPWCDEDCCRCDKWDDAQKAEAKGELPTVAGSADITDPDYWGDRPSTT